MSGRFRKQYRTLTDAEREHIEQIKDAAERLEMLIEGITGEPGEGIFPIKGETVRLKAFAISRLEEAVMWATKAAS